MQVTVGHLHAKKYIKFLTTLYVLKHQRQIELRRFEERVRKGREQLKTVPYKLSFLVGKEPLRVAQTTAVLEKSKKITLKRCSSKGQCIICILWPSLRRKPVVDNTCLANSLTANFDAYVIC